MAMEEDSRFLNLILALVDQGCFRMPIVPRFHVARSKVAEIRVAQWMRVDKVLIDTEARSYRSPYFTSGDDVNLKRKRFVESADAMPEEVTLLVSEYAANTILNQKISLSDDPGGDADGSSSVTAESSPRLEKNSNVRIDDDNDLIAKLAPLINRQIEATLNSTLLPLVAVLRTREEDEQRHREQMLALEEQKLALKRKKLLFKRRRVIQREPHSAKKRSRLRVKIPVL